MASQSTLRKSRTGLPRTNAPARQTRSNPINFQLDGTVQRQLNQISTNLAVATQNLACIFMRRLIARQRQIPQKPTPDTADLHSLGKEELINLLQASRDRGRDLKLQLIGKEREVQMFKQMWSEQRDENIELNNRSEYRHLHAIFGQFDQPRSTQSAAPEISMALRYEYENEGMTAYNIMMMEQAIHIQVEHIQDLQAENQQLKATHKTELDAKDQQITSLRRQINTDSNAPSNNEISPIVTIYNSGEEANTAALNNETSSIVIVHHADAANSGDESNAAATAATSNTSDNSTTTGDFEIVSN
ncbi:hypothetical protein L207DRAFT_535990 [Hyaloscypha variabilis F]|uniref:Uncharacterized protein n=1 Tax=Hyaloscypha variabilis (strain UAMH 11265 / GT02V1 / F) TaxID=1149755 RepID=A0A2J6R2F0_HYAVF|nr:hypothetical protein L207DRAFT_535990 [Hyaloscypha variabilis F]